MSPPKFFLCDLWILLICFLRHFYNILLLSVIGLNNVGPHFWWFQFWSFKLHLILMLPRIALLHVKGVQRCVTFKIKIHRYWILEPQISIPQILVFKVCVALSYQCLVLFIRSMSHLDWEPFHIFLKERICFKFIKFCSECFSDWL